MRYKSIVPGLLAFCLVLALALPAVAGQGVGPRIPTAYFATTGTGQSDQGIPPDPYETFSYDLALLQAGIENFNVVYYTSVLPPESYEVPLDSVKQYFHHGSVLETIMAKAGGIQGDTVCAGVGRVWAKDKTGKKIGGFAAEYERVYSGKTVDEKTAYADAKAAHRLPEPRTLHPRPDAGWRHDLRHHLPDHHQEIRYRPFRPGICRVHLS